MLEEAGHGARRAGFSPGPPHSTPGHPHPIPRMAPGHAGRRDCSASRVAPTTDLKRCKNLKEDNNVCNHHWSTAQFLQLPPSYSLYLYGANLIVSFSFADLISMFSNVCDFLCELTISVIAISSTMLLSIHSPLVCRRLRYD